MTTDTIFALSSGHGRAGVAVVRISGPAAGIVLDRMAAPRPRPRFAAFRRVKHPDDGRAHRSRPGAVVRRRPRARPARTWPSCRCTAAARWCRPCSRRSAASRAAGWREPGEFARRAFENGKLDLTGVEGLADLIDAETAAQRRQALRQTEGALGELYAGWRQRLIAATALMEAAIDFSDEADVRATRSARPAPRPRRCRPRSCATWTTGIAAR